MTSSYWFEFHPEDTSKPHYFRRDWVTRQVTPITAEEYQRKTGNYAIFREGKFKYHTLRSDKLTPLAFFADTTDDEKTFVQLIHHLRERVLRDGLLLQAFMFPILVSEAMQSQQLFGTNSAKRQHCIDTKIMESGVPSTWGHGKDPLIGATEGTQMDEKSVQACFGTDCNYVVQTILYNSDEKEALIGEEYTRDQLKNIAVTYIDRWVCEEKEAKSGGEAKSGLPWNIAFRKYNLYPNLNLVPVTKEKIGKKTANEVQTMVGLLTVRLLKRGYVWTREPTAEDVLYHTKREKLLLWNVWCVKSVISQKPQTAGLHVKPMDSDMAQIIDTLYTSIDHARKFQTKLVTKLT